MMETELEYLLTHSYKDQMIAGMAANPAFFNEAIRMALSDKQPYAFIELLEPPYAKDFLNLQSVKQQSNGI